MTGISALKRSFEAFMQEQLPASENPVYLPLQYIMELSAKRIRPMLCLKASALYGEVSRGAYYAALSVEVFHNFTLLHDDIMDKASLRRGRKSAHLVYGTNAAILSGDIMLLYSIQYLKHIEPARMRNAAIEKLLESGIHICEGQQLDLAFESRTRVSLADYLNMIEYKTAILLGLSLYLGALVSNAPPDDLNTLFDLGVSSGMAFQLQDDILDVYGEKDKIGKTTGGDILQNKKTVLYILAMENLNADDQLQLIDLYNADHMKPEEKIARVKALFQTSGAILRAEKLQFTYRQKTHELLDRLQCDQARRKPLVAYLNSVFSRNY